MDACLIAIAARPDAKIPLILAANRDEDYDRPTLRAAFWGDAPDILGGRDALQLGSWLAITRSGRFAAVTNLRGSHRDPRKRSRGELVSEFVRGNATPMEYCETVASREHQYAGFHLIAGEIGGEIEECGGERPHALGPIHALSNAPAGERWAKVHVAEEEMMRIAKLADVDGVIDEALRFLTSRNGEVFIASDRYGTRSSTVIVATQSHVRFVERSYARGGIPDPALRSFDFAIRED